MTTFLHPGDKIVLCAPSGTHEGFSDEDIDKALTDAYAALGVIVVFVAIGAPDIPLTVVSVLREPQPIRVPHGAEKLRLEEKTYPLKARWAPPWFDPETMELPPVPHPGYQDHPRVP